MSMTMLSRASGAGAMPRHEGETMDLRVQLAVAKLANLLRRRGSKILTNSCTLSLSLPVYVQISNALSLFLHHTSDSGATSGVLDCKLVLDLEYLKSFLSRVPSLLLFQPVLGPPRAPPCLSLAPLRHLRHLTIKRVRGVATVMADLSILHPSLLSLTLEGCTPLDLLDLLSTCLGSLPPSAAGRPWPGLSRLSVTRCELACLPPPSLAATPHLTVLDLSRNLLTDSEVSCAVELLDNLSALDLSYNRLCSLPSTHPSALLTSLCLAYNRLDQLPLSLEHLPYLQHLDLSANCLLHHDVLAPLSALTKLIHLDLRSNPLTSSRLHRTLAASWLNPGVSAKSFLLDTQPLSSAEVSVIGTSKVLLSPAPSPRDANLAQSHLEPLSLPLDPDSVPRSAFSTGSAEGSLVSGYTVTTMGGSRRKRKKKRARVAVITDEAEFNEDGARTDSVSTAERLDSAPSDHAVDRENAASQLSELRSELGSEWLRVGNREKLDSILGVQQEQPEHSCSDLVIQGMISRENSVMMSRENSIAIEFKEGTPDTPNVEVKPEEKEVQATESPVTESKVEDVGESRDKDKSETPDVCLPSTPDIYSYSRNTSPDSEVGLEDKGVRLSVKVALQGDDSGECVECLELAISSQFLREMAGGVTRVKWFRHSLEQVEMVKELGEGEVRVALQFNTLRRDRRAREYVMSLASYSTLLSLCQQQLEAAKQAVGSSFSTLQCVRCQSLFSQSEDVGGDHGVLCPHCGSSMLIETQQHSQDTEQAASEDVELAIPVCETLDLQKVMEGPLARASTPRELDAGCFPGDSAAAGEEEEPQVSPVKHLHVTADIHNHVIQSQDSQMPDIVPRNTIQRSMSCDSDGVATVGVVRSETSSDISVLSDPSEASIEVLAPNSNHETKNNSSYQDIDTAEKELSIVMEQSADNEKIGEEGDAAPVDEDPVYTDDDMNDTLEDIDENKDANTCDKINETDETIYQDEIEEPSRDVGDEEDTATFMSCYSNEGSEGGAGEAGSTLLHSQDTDAGEGGGLGEQESYQAPEPLMEPHVMAWDFNDFSIADHRLQLWCSMELFGEDEDLLLVCRSKVYGGRGGGLVPGVAVMSNSKLYLLQCSGAESEEVGSWLQLLASASLSSIDRLVGLLGGTGLAVQLNQPEAHQGSGHSFYRLPVPLPTLQHSSTNSTTTSCFYLLLGDRARSERLGEALVTLLGEVRGGQPTPVTWLQEQETQLLLQQLNCEDDTLDYFTSSLVHQGPEGWVAASASLTGHTLHLTGDFFTWVLHEEEDRLRVLTQVNLKELTGFIVYEAWPERLTLEMESEHIELQLTTEDGVRALVGALRAPWEQGGNTSLEEAIKFHMASSNQIIVMQNLINTETGSLTSSTFDLDQWVKITTKSGN